MTSFKSRVEQSSIGTRQGQAARRTVTTRTAAAIVNKAANAGSQRSGKHISKSVGGK